MKVVTGDDPDTKSYQCTKQVLQYIQRIQGVLAQMGIQVRVNPVRSQDLKIHRLVENMRTRGILSLPALTTAREVYLGRTAIQELYERNINEFAASRRGESSIEGAAPEDDLDSYFKDEMSFARAEEDAQEAGIGESDDMMDSYRRMMERREGSESGQKRPGGRTLAPAPELSRPAPPRSAPPRPATSSRPDNVAAALGPSRRPPPSDPEEDEIQATIDRLARDIDPADRERAFSSAGGDSYDDDGGGSDFQDDLMERAFYANLSSSELP